MQDDLWAGKNNQRYARGRFPSDPSLPRFKPASGTNAHRSRASYDWDKIYENRVKDAKKAKLRRGSAKMPQMDFTEKVGEGLSKYAGFNERELFAEAWTVYSDPRYVTGELKQLPLDIHNWMTKYLPRTIQN